jgi:hypothetical protein
MSCVELMNHFHCLTSAVLRKELKVLLPVLPKENVVGAVVAVGVRDGKDVLPNVKDGTDALGGVVPNNGVAAAAVPHTGEGLLLVRRFPPNVKELSGEGADMVVGTAVVGLAVEPTGVVVSGGWLTWLAPKVKEDGCVASEVERAAFGVNVNEKGRCSVDVVEVADVEGLSVMRSGVDADVVAVVLQGNINEFDKRE